MRDKVPYDGFMVWCIRHPILLLSLQRPLPDACGFAQAVLGVRSEYPLSILRNLTRPPPLFLRSLYPLPFGGVARDCFSRQIKRLLFIASLPSEALPDAWGFAQAVLGVRSEYPLSILRNLTRPPPCFCVVCTPSPLEGWLGTAFRAKSNAYYFSPWRPVPIDTWIPVREIREKVQKKAVFRGPAGPRKRGLFWTLPWILKATGGFMA